MFRPVMIGLAATLAVLIVAVGARYGRSPAAPVVVMTPPPAADAPPVAAVAPEAPSVVAPVRSLPLPVSDQLHPIPATERRWTSTWVNVREGRGTDNAVVATLDPGVPIDVYDPQQSWWAVIDAGRHLGYVANSVLLRQPPRDVAPGMEPPLVSQRTGR